MRFYFASFEEFLAMSGYGAEVWGAFTLVFCTFLVLFIFIQLQNKKTEKQVMKQAKLANQKNMGQH